MKPVRIALPIWPSQRCLLVQATTGPTHYLTH